MMERNRPSFLEEGAMEPAHKPGPAKSSSYTSYLLRVWKSDQDEEQVCRVSLERTEDEQQTFFPSLEALITYLRDQYGPKKEAAHEK
jgi:hypothetical protein